MTVRSPGGCDVRRKSAIRASNYGMTPNEEEFAFIRSATEAEQFTGCGEAGCDERDKEH